MGRARKKALDRINTLPFQPIQFLSAFHAFGQDAHVQRLCQTDQRIGETLQPRVFVNVLHKTSVNFDL